MTCAWCGSWKPSRAACASCGGPTINATGETFDAWLAVSRLKLETLEQIARMQAEVYNPMPATPSRFVGYWCGEPMYEVDRKVSR